MSILSGSVLSGGIYSGTIGNIMFASTIPMVKCDSCGRQSPHNLYQMILVPMSDTWDRYFCKECAGFDWEKKRFYNREDAIRESVPDAVMDLPTPVLADWCEDNGRPKDAIYLRELD